MKINTNEIKITPSDQPFGFCVYGQPSEPIQAWIDFHKLETVKSNSFINILIPNELDITKLFNIGETYKYMDGFSPNLNKHLHVGHLSNLIITSALYNLGKCDKTIAILGDTQEGNVESKDAYLSYQNIIPKFNYTLCTNDIHYASKQDYTGDLLEDGDGDYDGTKVFDINGQKLVGIKSDGTTSYFYQDVALATKLNKPTLYLTGFEQNGHFETLSKLIPTVKHIGLGLVMVDGKKMSSREGNVIMAQEIIDKLDSKFEDDKVGVNVLIGQILKSKLESIKKVVTKDWDNPKSSPGLYLSYTFARMKSAGMVHNIGDFNNNKVKFAMLKAKSNNQPSFLLDVLIDLSKKINGMYMDYIIKDNEPNQKLYQPLLDDLATGMKMLGMNLVDKV